MKNNSQIQHLPPVTSKFGRGFTQLWTWVLLSRYLHLKINSICKFTRYITYQPFPNGHFSFSNHCHSHNFLWQLSGSPLAWKLLGERLPRSGSGRYTGGRGLLYMNSHHVTKYNFVWGFQKAIQDTFIAVPKRNLKIWMQAPTKVPEVKVETCVLWGRLNT